MDNRAGNNLRNKHIVLSEHPRHMAPYPAWLHIVAWAYLSLSFVSALIITFDELRRPQNMMIMNFVWPITALYGGPLAVWGYLKSAPKLTKAQMHLEIQAELSRETTKSGVRQMPNDSGENGPTRTGRRRRLPLWSRLYGRGHRWRVVDFRCRSGSRGRRTRDTPSARFPARMGIWSRLSVLHEAVFWFMMQIIGRFAAAIVGATPRKCRPTSLDA